MLLSMIGRLQATQTTQFIPTTSNDTIYSPTWGRIKTVTGGLCPASPTCVPQPMNWPWQEGLDNESVKYQHFRPKPPSANLLLC